MPESRAQNQVLLPRIKSSLVMRKPKIVNLPPEILETRTKMGIGDAGKWRGTWTDSLDARKSTTGDLSSSGILGGIPPEEGTVPELLITFNSSLSLSRDLFQNRTFLDKEVRGDRHGKQK